ncbi:MAG: hypothetical protein GKR90_27265 [Pseudomonadales bacterium]|nr:hypothetical protein [Pseudomonadales bacterium]
MDHQAFAQLLGNYGEFIGSIAVVVTLAYLAVQIRQNSKMMQAQTRSVIAQNTVALFQSIDVEGSEIFLRGASDGLEVGSAEWFVFQGRVQAALRTYENELFQYEQGLFGEELISTRQTIWASMVGPPGVQAVWQNVKLGYSPAFQQVVDQLIKDSDGGKVYWQTRSVDE